MSKEQMRRSQVLGQGQRHDKRQISSGGGGESWEGLAQPSLALQAQVLTSPREGGPPLADGTAAHLSTGHRDPGASYPRHLSTLPGLPANHLLYPHT